MTYWRSNISAGSNILAIFFLLAVAAVGQGPDFSMAGEKILQVDEDLGIANGRITCGVSKEFLGRVDGVWAPPFASSDFALRWKLDGQELALKDFTWRPNSVTGSAATAALQLSYAAWLVPGRGLVQAVRVHALDADAHAFTLRVEAAGSLDTIERWEFARAVSSTPARDALSPSGLVLKAGDNALALQSPVLRPAAGAIQGEFIARGKNDITVFVALAVGDAAEAAGNAQQALEVAGAIPDPFAPRAFKSALPLPQLHSDNSALDGLFSRSLLHLLMNRWEVREFKLNPYYATGSVKGGCLCNYLWNFGEVWEILPLLDPDATKAHIKQFLACDMTTHFAFDPIGGEAFGPWYPVNQEKIIGLIYFYVLISGDTAFLDEVVDGKTIAEHAVLHALVKDDLTRSAAMIDYGPSNSHLELRKEFQYNHVIPDLNGRRYENLVRAAAIARWAGAPRPDLLAHAEELKAVFARELWVANAKWFRFINGDGKPELRYTMQVFKLFNSAVLAPEHIEGLLSHFNEHEFFSEFGMHSMSKLDPAYDQVDVDNGGGGACTCFPPQIAERLYKLGKIAQADDILRRILWWGDRLAYWGDSIVANAQEYRKDTPLQCTLDGATVAQTILFGLFGIAAREDGGVEICPRNTKLFKTAEVSNLTLRHHRFSIAIADGRFTVTEGDTPRTAALGERITLHGK